MEEKLLDARIKALMVAAYTMAGVICAITGAMVIGLFMPNDLIDNEKVFALLGYVMTSVISAVAGSYATLMGMKGEPQATEIPELSQSSKVDTPVNVSVVNDVDTAPAETFFEKEEQPELDLDEPVDLDGDGVLQPWEIHAKDMRYDANGDGVVDENDFPDWRSAGK